MKNLMRNLTLSAAALAALMSIAPKAAAQDRGRERGRARAGASRGIERREPGRQEFRGYGRQESRGRAYRGPGRDAYTPPVRPFYGSRNVAPFRIHAGSRFYSTRPGLGYLFVSGLGWVFPPFPGAVWVPAHYDYDGYYVEGCWR